MIKEMKRMMEVGMTRYRKVTNLGLRVKNKNNNHKIMNYQKDGVKLHHNQDLVDFHLKIYIEYFFWYFSLYVERGIFIPLLLLSLKVSAEVPTIKFFPLFVSLKLNFPSETEKCFTLFFT